MKVQIDHIELRPNDDKSMGEILVEGHLLEGYREFSIKFNFPDGRELFSSQGDYDLIVECQDAQYRKNRLKDVDSRVDEGFRDALGSYNTLCPKRLKKACEALFDALKLGAHLENLVTS